MATLSLQNLLSKNFLNTHLLEEKFMVIVRRKENLFEAAIKIVT